MNRRFVKSLIVSFVSLMLFYYSAAWAMLKCFHDGDHSTRPLQIAETDARSEFLWAESLSEDPGNLECIAFDYHAEYLAGSSSLAELKRWAARPVAHVTDFSILDGVIVEGGAKSFSLSAVFDRVSSPSFPIDLPRYLSLSVLRI